MGKQTHIRAVNRTISALNVDEMGVGAASVAMLRTLARALDSAADDDRFAKLAPLYLSSLRTVQRHARPAATEAGSSAETSTADVVSVPVSALEEFRRRRAADLASRP